MPPLKPIAIDPQTFLREHCVLPALPEVLTKFQEFMTDPSVSTVDIAGLIKKDPAVYAQILKIINSAYYSLPIEISDAKLAVAYLGIHEVYKIILSVSVINTLATEQKTEFDRIWFHSLLTAFCAKYFAKKFESQLDKNELWTMAILHDVGKLVYLKFFPEHYGELHRYSEENGCLFSEAESHFSVPASAYLGTLLCKRWRLPDKIKNACGSHSLHDLKRMNQEKQKNPYITMVILGNLVAVLSTDELRQKKRSEIIAEIIKTTAIEESDFMLIMGDVVELKEEVNRLF